VSFSFFISANDPLEFLHIFGMGGDLYHDSNAAATRFVIWLNTEPLPKSDLKQKITPGLHTALPDPVTLLRLPTPNDEILPTSLSHFSTETNNTNALTTTPTAVADVVVRANGEELPSNLSVLFVDDDAILRTTFKRALKRVAPNWKIKEEDCGESALENIAASGVDDCPDLIFVDQYMHGKSDTEPGILGTQLSARCVPWESKPVFADYQQMMLNVLFVTQVQIFHHKAITMCVGTTTRTTHSNGVHGAEQYRWR